MKLNHKFTLIILVFVFGPIVIFSLFLFHNMEQTTIHEGYKSLEYSIQKSYDEIIRNVDNVNVSAEFFLSDRSLFDYLRKINSHKEISHEEMMNFYNVNISALERMVNSNPYIYQIRVYVDEDSMQEMVPILYHYDRMSERSWGKDEDISGWKFDSVDEEVEEDETLLSLVTPMVKDDELLGVLEVSILMDTMFPAFYDENDSSIAFFVDNLGGIHCSDQNRALVMRYMQEAMLQDMMSRATQKVNINYQEWDQDSLLVGVRYIDELNGTLIHIDNLKEELDNLRRSRNHFLVVVLVISVVFMFFVNFVVKRLLSQLYRIVESIREVQKGNLNVEIQHYTNDEVGELGAQINKMLERIRQLMEDNLKRERLVKNSEIRALQNQINAHFIYNVLESIKMMAEIDEKYDISDAITSLGKLLRYTMRWTSGNVTVGEELEYIKNYLALINLRFDYEIYLSLNMSDLILHQEIPKMSLQPIVENAICHGIEQIAEDTNIYVKGTIDNGDCIIEITDSGKGMSEEQIQALYRRMNGEIEADGGGTGNGIGLKNVQDRIKMNFGEEYGISIASKLGCYTKVQVRIPQTYFDIRQQEKAES